MRRYIATGLLILAVALFCPYLRADTLSFEYTSPEALWAFVCERDGACGDLPAPALEHRPLMSEMGAIGAFMFTTPTKVLFDIPMAWAITGNRQAVDAMIVHEFQHYLDFNLGRIAPVASERCRAEASGFAAQIDYLLLNFAEQYIEHDWRIRYGC